jgi:simple sugar transport system ATP-binding protein
MALTVEMRKITKRFGPLVANDHVDFDLRPGEIHCLLGENGAGKTTLMNVLYGMWPMDEGELFIEDRKVHFRSPSDAMAQRIGMVSQHYSLIPTLSVTENIVLAKIPTQHIFFVDKRSAKKRVLDLAETFGFTIEPDAKIEDLSAGEQQRVEILKALYHNAKIIILDEPTAVLTPQETHELFGIMRNMAKEGQSVIIITHKLNEAMNSDRLTVMRNGRVIWTKNTGETTKDDITEAMFGQKLLATRDKKIASKGRPVLELKNVWTSGDGSNSLKEVTFSIAEGEIFGVAGVAGNGQNTLVSVIMSICRAEKGSILIKGKDITNKSPRLCRDCNIVCIPEERKRSGILQGIGIAENLILGRENKLPFARGVLLDYSNIKRFANEMIMAYEIKATGIRMPVHHLSGGNVQKVILAREFASEPNFIIASQPTRGLDAKTVDFVYKKLREERDKGKAILFFSYDLDEILEMSDRIGVLYNGRMEIVSTVDPYEIGRMMVGIKDKG